VKFVLENNKIDKKLQFRSFDVLKDEARKIIQKKDWVVKVTLTQNYLYLNLWMFPESFSEQKQDKGFVTITFPLTECMDYD
jgi:hypothetical protein